MSSIYKQGESRNQQLLFPPSIDDYVDSNNTVRAIDAYVDILDLSSLKFSYIPRSHHPRWEGISYKNKKVFITSCFYI